MSEPIMNTYTVHWSPSDFPGRYVVRAWRIVPGAEPMPASKHILCTSLAAARRAIVQAHPGAYCLPRAPEDDPAIVETWL